MINKLDWDSELFGYPIGKMESINFDASNLSYFKRAASDYKLVYLFLKQELQEASNEFMLVDKKATFMRSTNLITNRFSFNFIESYNGALTNQLKELTLQSGIHSRFKRDKNFKNYEYEKLYTTWIEKSINRAIAKEIFVYKKYEDLLGFVTLEEKLNTANIGLIAVDQKGRKKGIGTALIEYTVNKAFESGYFELFVATQLDNLAAVQLYNKNGFKLIDLTYIYHYWKA